MSVDIVVVAEFAWACQLLVYEFCKSFTFAPVCLSDLIAIYSSSTVKSINLA